MQVNHTCQNPTTCDVKSLHAMPEFTSTTRRIQVGNGQYVGVLFVIPVIITIQDHIFESFMLVSEVHENVDQT